MHRSRYVTVVWLLAISGIVTLPLVGIGTGPVQGQTPEKAYYYGKAVSDAGEKLPAGTEIRAIVEEDGEKRTLDSLTMEEAGEYGGAGLGEPKLGVPTDLDERIYFVAVNGNGRFVANWSVKNPEPGTRRQDLSFPPGSAEPQPYFRVTDLQPGNVTVVEGTTVTVNATVTNDGSEPGTQTVSLDVGGNTAATRDVTLDEGASTTVEFALDAGSVSPGNYTYGIYTADTSQTATLSVEDRRATFAVSGLDPTDATVVRGDALNVSATVTNDGNAKGTQTVEYRVDGTTLTGDDVTLAAGESTTVNFTDIDTAQFDSGTHTHSVATENDSQTGTLTVRARRANFAVSGLDPGAATVTTGDEFGVTATVTNDGTVEGTQTAAFRIGDTTIAKEELTLDSGASETVAFPAANTSQFGPGTYAYGVYTANDSQTGTLVIESETDATFAVSDLTPPATTVSDGGLIDVSATVTNEGDSEATQQVQLRIGGERVDRRAVTLAESSQTRVEFTGIETAPYGPGTYTYGVYTANDSQTGTLTVERGTPPAFTVSDLTPTETTADRGAFIEISATVTNRGETTTGRISLHVDGKAVDTKSVTVASGDNTTVTFEGIPVQFDPGTHTYSVRTATDSQSGTLTVEGDHNESTPGGTPETETPTQTPATATATEDGGGGNGGLIPEIVKTVLFYLAVLVAVVYLVLKALAIYLGY